MELFIENLIPAKTLNEIFLEVSGNISERYINSTIEGPLVRTAIIGPRTIIEGNDIYVFDDSTGGVSPVTGDTATIFFPRTDDETQRFMVRKRAGKNYDDENIMEMFYEKAANNSRENYVFIGRAGDQAVSAVKTDIISIIENQIFEVDHKNSASPLWYMINSSYSGAQSVGIWGDGLTGGTRSIFSFKDMGTALVFSDSPSFAVGDLITGNATGATAYIGTKTDANHYIGVFVNGTFNPATDNACTTNGGGGGSGTGNLDSITSTEFNVLDGTGGGVLAFGHQAVLAGTTYLGAQAWIDAYNIWIDDDIKFYTDNAWDIGSSSHRIKDIYLAGSVYKSRARVYRATSDQDIVKNTAVKIEFNAESYDGLGEFDPTTNYRFTATVAGYYLCSAHINWGRGSAGNVNQIWLYKNGSFHNKSLFITEGLVNQTQETSDIIYLAANGYIEVIGVTNSATDELVTAGSEHSYLTIHRLS